MRSLLAASAVLLVLALLAGAVVVATSEPDERADTTAENERSELLATSGGLSIGADGRIRDEHGRLVVTADGEELPEGSRLDDRGRVVLPDGRVLGPGRLRVVDRRTERRWARERRDAETERPQRVERERLQTTAEERGERAAEPPGPRSVTANLRPAAEHEGATAATDESWEPATEKITAPDGTEPALEVEAPPPRTKRRAERTGSRARGSESDELQWAREHGLRGDYFDFLEGELRTVPELAELPPTFTRIDRAIDFTTDDDFALPFHPDTFAVLWRGRLLVPQDGTYHFVCGSDDGVRLRIGGGDVIGAPDLRPYAESEGSAQLTAGAHDFELTFYENYIFASCRLFWSGPGLSRRVIAPEYFAPPEDLADVVRPHITRIEPARAFVGDEVVVRGTGFSGEAAFVAVEFDGVPAEVLEATTDSVRVRVPVGAATGDVVARIGGISSLPEPFEVRNLVGLHAEYFRIGADLTSYPNYDELAPYFIRLDGPLDFHRDDLWRLPYKPDVFAARWTGYLYVPEADDYEITLGSDDGARLSLAGETYIDMPGLHAYEEASRKTHFAQGFHPLELIFFENRGVARLRLFWQRRGEPTRTVIPRGFLYAPEELARRPAPELRTVEPRTTTTEGELTLTGTGFGDDPRYVRVEFPGGVWVRPDSTTDTQLTCRVPFGTESGDVRVHVGVRTSGPQPITLHEPLGLRADYYRLSNGAAVEQLDLATGLDGLNPTHSRTETRFRRHGAADWELPFPPDHFVAHWHGSVLAEQVEALWWIVQARDGAELWIGGRRVVGLGDRPALAEASGPTRLSRGAHAIDLYLRHTGDDPRFHLFWTRDGLADHLDVPARWFRPTRPSDQGSPDDG